MVAALIAVHRRSSAVANSLGCRRWSTSRRAREWVFIVSMLGVVACGGCVSGEDGRAAERVESPEARMAREGERIKADPVAYLRDLKERCAALDQYRLTFYRQERLGFIPKLVAMERIRAAFRKEPFSVKFEWDDETMPYFESVYVAGRHNNQVLVRERHGLFPFPPQVRIIDVDLPVAIGKAKNPITSFGLAQVAARTLAPFEDPALAGVMTIAYEGVSQLEPINRAVHHLRIQRPPTPGYLYTQQDFYVDAETGWPAGTDLWLKNEQLDARYRYGDVRTDVHLTDSDFRLAEDHPDEEKGQAASKAAR
ncbi:MAG: DUF1571 domain-containing protein [Phycisphaerae bacterium]|nr:DUF1571 domain-containing protein [Phycisphaerae bacterium]